jgi:hypothetical protein
MRSGARPLPPGCGRSAQSGAARRIGAQTCDYFSNGEGRYERATERRSATPSSSKICWSSASAFFAKAPSTLTVNSIPTRRPSPFLSLGSTLVPSRFQISGGMVPESRSKAFSEVGGSGCGPGFGRGSGADRGSGGWGAGGEVLSCCALSLVSSNMLESKAISSGSTGSACHTRWYSPASLTPDANPKSPRSTNSRILRRNTASGSSSRSSCPCG